MGLVVRAALMAHSELKVHPGRSEAFVAEQLAHRFEVDAVLDQMRRKRVAQRVRAGVLLNAAYAVDVVEDAPDVLRREPGAAAAEK